MMCVLYYLFQSMITMINDMCLRSQDVNSVVSSKPARCCLLLSIYIVCSKSLLNLMKNSQKQRVTLVVLLETKNSLETNNSRYIKLPHPSHKHSSHTHYLTIILALFTYCAALMYCGVILHMHGIQVIYYAGNVVYNVKDFVNKNMVIKFLHYVRLSSVPVLSIMQDEPLHDLTGILYNCKLPILKEMFPEVSKLLKLIESMPYL